MTISLVSNTNQIGMAQVLDRNKDGKLQLGSEINMAAPQLKAIDANKDGELSTSELSSAIQQDYVSIQYKTNEASDIRLNPDIFRGSSNDKSQGFIYGGAGLGTLAGLGIGFLVGGSAGSQIGALVGAAAGVGTGVYFSAQQKVETVYNKIDQSKEADQDVVKPYAIGGAIIGAGLGAAAGYFGFSKTGLMDFGTGIFAGAAVGATLGMGVGSGIGTAVSLKQKED
ncbi:MAG: hypothetical protein AB7I41_17710 [Candidatus Sericytochromatia bacterium]